MVYFTLVPVWLTYAWTIKKFMTYVRAAFDNQKLTSQPAWKSVPILFNYLGIWWSTLKFLHSEKATKFREIFTLLLSYVYLVKSEVKISQNFVAFSEYMNFKLVPFVIILGWVCTRWRRKTASVMIIRS